LILDTNGLTAAEHARLLAHVRRTGTPPRDAHDLLIAEPRAVEHGRAIVSLDARARFGDLPGVQAVDD
jgi:tRNA(fMet)-specific endonuclease VapC